MPISKYSVWPFGLVTGASVDLDSILSYSYLTLLCSGQSFCIGAQLSSILSTCFLYPLFNECVTLGFRLI